MQFVHRIRTIWSWLPSFRAVAETQHLPSAAQELGVVPSSLSRMVKQVEDELGIALFDRSSKSLELNEAGRVLLIAVREAMRVVDDALVTAAGDDLRGTVTAVATGDLAHSVLGPAAAVLTAEHPGIVLVARLAAAEEIEAMLLAGDADAAVITHAAPVHPDLRATELAAWSRSVYGHPRREVEEYRAVVVGRPDRWIDDGWPPSCERKIVAWVPDERAALALCARTELVTVAFDSLARASALEGHVTRTGLEAPARTLRLVHRRAVGRHRRTEALIAAIRASTAAPAAPQPA